MELTCVCARDHASLPEEVAARARLTFASWGRGLTPEQYLDRERALWALPFSRDGLRVWLLRDPSGEVLASCESYAVAVEAKGRRGLFGGRTDERGTGHGIATVFVEERLRGRGLASQLLGLVHERLRAEGALCAYLISEVGPAIYARLGYTGRTLSIKRFSATAPGDDEPGLDEVSFLVQDDVPSVLARRAAAPSLSPLSIHVSADQIGWHLGRSRFYASVLGKSMPTSVGVTCGPAFALWAHEFHADLLRVLMLYPGPELCAHGTILDPRHEEAVALRNLLHAARAEAGHHGLSGVEVWENATNSGWLRGGLRVEAREVPMMLPLRRLPSTEWLDWERAHWL